MGIVPVLVVEWGGLPWRRHARTTDASEHGYGIVFRTLEANHVAQVGRVRERDLHRYREGHLARHWAWQGPAFTELVDTKGLSESRALGHEDLVGDPFSRA